MKVFSGDLLCRCTETTHCPLTLSPTLALLGLLVFSVPPGSLQTAFPRFPCQQGFSCILPMGGTPAREESGKKVEAILFLAVLPVVTGSGSGRKVQLSTGWWP